MSLLTSIVPPNPYAEVVVHKGLGLKRRDFARFRDAYPSADGLMLYVLTRIGGTNRASYQQVFEMAKKHPAFVQVLDEKYDPTYATFQFNTPKEFVPVALHIADETDITPTLEKFQKVILDLQENRDNAGTSRAMEVGKKIFETINSGMAGHVQTETGGCTIIPLGEEQTIGDQERDDDDDEPSNQ